MKYIQVDNLINERYLNRLYDLLAGNNDFPWFYLGDDISLGAGANDIDESQRTVGFTHLLRDHDGMDSSYLPHFLPLLDAIQDGLGVDCNFMRCRLALQLNNGQDRHNLPHTDHHTDHYAAIFYFHDSSGDTVFFDQYDDPKSGTVTERWNKVKTQEYTECMRVTPKANRLFIFDGHQCHASSNPITNKSRFILNLNFTCEHDILR